MFGSWFLFAETRFWLLDVTFQALVCMAVICGVQNLQDGAHKLLFDMLGAFALAHGPGAAVSTRKDTLGFSGQFSNSLLGELAS